MTDILKNGKKSKYNCLNIYTKKNELLFNRSAIVISRRVGSAVIRNKIKRRLREIVRTNKKSHPPYFDLIIQPQSGIEKIKFDEIALCIQKLIETQG